MRIIYRLGFITGLLSPFVYFFVYNYDKLPEKGKLHSWGLLGSITVLVAIYKIFKGSYDRKIQAAEHLKMAKKPNYSMWSLKNLKAIRSIYVLGIIGFMIWFSFFLVEFGNEIKKVLMAILIFFAIGFIFEYLAEGKEEIKE